MRQVPYTTARLRRWLNPKRNPLMNDQVPPREPEEPEDENEDEEQDEDEGDDEPVESWECGDALTVELYAVPADPEDGTRAHDELTLIEDPDEGEAVTVEHIVSLGSSVEELDELIEVLTEARGVMAARAKR
jgi:hypothetical protein